jgi:hypothetical protein
MPLSEANVDMQSSGCLGDTLETRRANLVAEPPGAGSSLRTATDDIIDSLVCPPPPSDSALNEDAISSLIVPAPAWSKCAQMAP